jgi:hypothetical protein
MKISQHHQEGKTFTPIGRKHYSISFSLPSDVIEALNAKVGNTKGARSEFASQVLAKALGMPVLDI